MSGVTVAVECKSKKMTVGAKFSDNPLDDAKIGYDEMMKAVVQVWRFFSHVRRGLIPDHPVVGDAVGLVLTLDSWMEMFGSMRGETLARAEQFAARADPNIEPSDRRPVVFCPIDDLERTLRSAS